MPWLPKFSVAVLLIVQVATMVMVTVNDAVAVEARGRSTDCNRQAAARITAGANRDLRCAIVGTIFPTATNVQIARGLSETRSTRTRVHRAQSEMPIAVSTRTEVASAR